nr:type I inositol polyphosphate 5-phosphatase 13 isoform X1 [Tanacetum cinerariifolium]
MSDMAYHRGPVLSMVTSSYGISTLFGGDMWIGSENGIIKVWSWEALENHFLYHLKNSHTAFLLVERFCIDLKGQVTINGACSVSSSDVKYRMWKKVLKWDIPVTPIYCFSNAVNAVTNTPVAATIVSVTSLSTTPDVGIPKTPVSVPVSSQTAFVILSSFPR